MPEGGNGTTRRRDPVRAGMILTAVAFLGVMVVLPVAIVFFQALGAGTGRFFAEIVRRDALHAFRLSGLLTLLAVLFNTVFGISMALLLARRRFRFKAWLLAVLDLPISISPVVVGLMLVLLFGRTGWFGPALARQGIHILFSFPGMLLATIFVSLPFVAREVLPVLEEMGTSEEEAARTLGASGWQTFLFVTIPAIRWGVLYGVLQCAARCLGEFGAVAIVSGKLIMKTNTVPLHIERMYLEYDTVGAFAAAVPLAALAILTLILQVWLKRRVQSPGAAEPARRRVLGAGTGGAERPLARGTV